MSIIRVRRAVGRRIQRHGQGAYTVKRGGRNGWFAAEVLRKLFGTQDAGLIAQYQLVWMAGSVHTAMISKSSALISRREDTGFP